MIKPIDSSDAIARLRAIGPPIEDVWRDATSFWAPEEPPLIQFFSDCGWAAVQLVRAQDRTGDQVFDLMEVLCRKGDSEVQEAVVTGFIERLESSSARDVPWIERLGPALRAAAAVTITSPLHRYL